MGRSPVNSNPSNNYSRKDENFITIFGWMTNRLKLSGNELLIYALIFSFAKDGVTEFHGSANYIASALNMSRRTVVSTLKSLTNNGLIKKKITGRYCHYTVQPVQNLHNTCANFAHHIKDISKVDIESGGSSARKPTTTTVDIFIKACKKAGFSLDKKKATKALSAGIEPAWLEGSFTFPEYVAGIIQENYADKPLEQKRKLFIALLTKEDRIDAFPQWRQNKKAEAVAQEKHHRKSSADLECRQKLDKLRKAGPQKCGNCGEAILAPGSNRGICTSCGFDYFLNEGKGEWEFNKPISLSAEFRQLTKGRRQKETEKTGPKL